MKNLEDLEKIINSELTTKINSSKIKHDQLYINIDEKGCYEIAKRSRGTPRIANRILKRSRDFAEINNDGFKKKQKFSCC